MAAAHRRRMMHRDRQRDIGRKRGRGREKEKVGSLREIIYRVSY